MVNYLTFYSNKYYTQPEGELMGSPISSIKEEIFIRQYNKLTFWTKINTVMESYIGTYMSMEKYSYTMVLANKPNH